MVLDPEGLRPWRYNRLSIIKEIAQFPDTTDSVRKRNLRMWIVPMRIEPRFHLGLKAVLPVLSAFLCVVEASSVGQAQVAGPSPVYAQKVPDDASTTVGPGYSGLDPAMIVSALEATGITEPKSEYETSADYQKRRATLPTHGDLNGLPPDGRLAFVLNGPAARGGSTLGGVELGYDADRQLMSVKIDIAKSDFGPNAIFPAFSFQSTVLHSSQYTGENAFGATADVTSLVIGGFGITAENGTWLTPLGELSARASYPQSGSLALIEHTGVTLPLQMPPLVAKDVSDHLRVLLICSLTSPWLRQTTWVSSGATIQDPSEASITTKFIHVSPEAVWIFDERNGNIIAKFTSSSLKAEWQRIALDYEQARRKLYPLKLEAALNEGFSIGVFSYQIDDQPEQSGPGPYGYIQLPLVVEAKNQVSITVRDQDRHQAEAYAKCFEFKLNGVQVKPKWQTGKNPMTHRDEDVAIFKLP